MGGGISNSQIITEEGKYALDAVQNNPSVPDSLRNELNRVSDKVDRQIINAWNDFADNAPGYIKLITIKIVWSYINYPLSFTVIGREFNKPISLTVLFDSVQNRDPNVKKYTFEAGISNVYDYKFYIVKETISTWSIYASKPQYATMAVIRAEIFRALLRPFFEVTYPNILVDSLPDGSLEFTTE